MKKNNLLKLENICLSLQKNYRRKFLHFERYYTLQKHVRRHSIKVLTLIRSFDSYFTSAAKDTERDLPTLVAIVTA